MVSSGALRCLTVDVRDRFGDYGLVGVMIYELRPTILDVDTLLLSCRALGRGVEHRMLAELGKIAAANGSTAVIVRFVPTRKNQPIHEFLEGMGAEFRRDETDSTRYEFPADFAATVLMRLPQKVGRVSETEQQWQFPAVDDNTRKAANLARIALELRSPRRAPATDRRAQLAPARR